MQTDFNGMLTAPTHNTSLSQLQLDFPYNGSFIGILLMHISALRVDLVRLACGKNGADEQLVVYLMAS